MEAICSHIGQLNPKDVLQRLIEENTVKALSEGLRDAWPQVRYAGMYFILFNNSNFFFFFEIIISSKLIILNKLKRYYSLNL